MNGIYIHIPFCEQKCYYCDFLSFPGRHRAVKEKYLTALAMEIKRRVTASWQKTDSIFIGGGTPTTLSAKELEKLLQVIKMTVDVESVKEYTVEANPGTIDREKLDVLLAGGVNRLSFGVQSFDNQLLQRIGRIHTAQEAIDAVELAKVAGFQNINVDLMYGLPGQTQEQWQESLSQALTLQTTHLSLYQLIVEPHTAIAKKLEQGFLPKIDEDGAAEWYDWQREWLAERGFAQYEISNYAQKGYESIHNQLYWDLDPYLGLGLGATGWSRPNRVSNTNEMNRYLLAQRQGIDDQSVESLSLDEQMEETVFMSLRMNRGLTHEKFQQLYGESLERIFPEAIEKALKHRWIIVDDKGMCLTDEGRRMGNWVFELFLK